MCCNSGVWATIHTSSWTFLRSLIALRYAFSSPCAPCVTCFCQFSYQFSLFFIVFVYIEWNKHSLSSPRRGVVPEEWWGPMRRSDDQEIWRNMLEKQALPNFRPSSQFLILGGTSRMLFGSLFTRRLKLVTMQLSSGQCFVLTQHISRPKATIIALWHVYVDV